MSLSKFLILCLLVVVAALLHLFPFVREDMSNFLILSLVVVYLVMIFPMMRKLLSWAREKND